MIKFWEYFVKFLHKLKVIKYFNFSVWLKFYDRNVKIPIIGEMGLYNLVMDEYWISDVYKLVHHDYKTCIDFGANLGQTLIKLKSVDPSCKYIGVEPNINCIFYLNELVHQNKYKDTSIISAAIGEEGKLDVLNFLWDEKADRSATQYPDSNSKVIHKQVVSSITYDYLSPLFTDVPLFVKIDIEKAEHVLLKHVLQNENNIVLVEILPGSKNRDLQRINECNECIKSFQFEIYRVIKHKEHLAGFQKLDQIPTEGKIEESDFMLVHGKHSERFKSNTIL